MKIRLDKNNKKNKRKVKQAKEKRKNLNYFIKQELTNNKKNGFILIEN